MADNVQATLRRIRRRIIAAMLLVVATGIAVIGWVPVDQKIPAAGVVVADREIFLFAPENGLIQEVRAREGATVRAGDELLALNTTAEENRRSQFEAELREATALAQFKQAQVDRVSKLPLPAQFWHARTELAESEEKARHAALDRQRYQQLFAAKLASEMDFDQRKLNEQLANDAVAKARETVSVLERGLEDSIVKEAVADLNAAHARVERLKTEIAISQSEIDGRHLRAPVDGQITLLLKQRAGEGVVKGEELIHLCQGPAVRARLYVGETQIHRIRPGQPVRLQSRAFDALRYGYITGHVEEVAPESDPRPTASDQGRYRVSVRIDQTPVPLVLGSSVDGQIILRRLPIWRLLLPQTANP